MTNYDDFSKAPVTITELKGQKEKDGSITTPRDALIAVLRDLDSGNLELETVYICYKTKQAEDKSSHFGFSRGGEGGWRDDLALLEGLRLDIWEWAREPYPKGS